MADHALGFLMTLVAGLATVLGAGFIPILQRVPSAEARLTAGSLGFAAGVMLYVSFVDVLGEEAKEFFENHFKDKETNSSETTLRRLEEDEEPESQTVRVMVALFFFIGIAVGMGLHWFAGDAAHGSEESTRGSRTVEMTQNPRSSASKAADPLSAHPAEWPNSVQEAPEPLPSTPRVSRRSNAALQRVSMVAFLALTLHNVPEGLATFFSGGAKNWKVPFAIALHNIPEGAAIAIPHFQVTGSLREAMQRTLIAGLAQPVGAAFGYLLVIILHFDDIPDFLYGAMYAMTAGIMVCVSLMELIPEALGDTSPFFVGCCIFAGFVLMEISIVCLGLAGV